MGSATLIVKATRSGRREVRANRRRCSVEGLGSRCVLRALWVSVVRCVSESMGVHAPANLASFSLHKQKGRGVRAGRAERAERRRGEQPLAPRAIAQRVVGEVRWRRVT